MLRKMRSSFMAAVGALALAASAFADTGAITAAQEARRDLAVDYSKQALAGAPGAVAAAPNAYAQEAAQMASQLQVISDNEDINYTIVEGDTLTVVFNDRDQKSRAAYKVSPAGEVHMPLLGPVKVSGLNRKQARERIDMMLREYFREPQAAVAINTDGRMMIFGAVMKPGLYTLAGKSSVMEAIFMAGGYNPKTAELASVVVIRGSPQKPLMLKLNLKKLVTRGDRNEDIAVKPGDFIYVPTSMISNLDTFWQFVSGALIRWYTWLDLKNEDGSFIPF
jgi:polysaccharide biosynthesis/export protein